ncbi:MAG: aminotransferase class I/II-fold pyridoxal phosphate-dependent enzyme [Saprospirales bacterium]|nr:MAG: aminotransferase class I/II-fold pyridoxal phosphate-dependent enzyme [Saprospirales bacterium]
MSFKPPPGKLPDSELSIFSVMSALAAKHNAINLAQGFPDFDCDPALKRFVTHYMERGYNQYAPMAGVPPLREVLANKIHRLYKNDVCPEKEITITAGATQAIFTAISAIVHPGDEVILIEPAYDCYGPAVKVNGGRVIPCELTHPDYRVDWDKLANLISEKTRMIVINNPHNPCGTVLETSDLETLYKIIRDKQIVVLSDEVYEHLVFDGLKHQSVLGHPGLYERSIVTFSFGKTFHNTGWKIGYAVAPPALMEEFRKVHQFNVFSVNTPIQYGLSDYLQNSKHYESLGEFYQKKRNLFSDLMGNTPFKPIPSSGSYFQLYDYSAISEESDVEFAKKMTTDTGVAVIPVSVFYSARTDRKVVRFCFAKKEETLKMAGKRMAEYFRT